MFRFIDTLGALILKLCSLLNKINIPKNIKLFLYRRNLIFFAIDRRVFIKLDENAERFIQDVLSSEFEHYQIVDNDNPLDKFLMERHKPKNKFITQVWFNHLFEFEMIPVEYWEHLEFSIKMREEYNLPLHIDPLFIVYTRTIKEFYPNEGEISP